MFTEPFVQDSDLKSSGWIEVISGPMFSGKTEELMRRLRRAMIANQKIELYKPAIDDRFHKQNVVSHDETEMESITILNASEILKRTKDADVLAIDEVQFFDDNLIEIVVEIANRGTRVILAGLDKDYQAQPFGPMPKLMAVSEFVTKLHAICMKCGGLASFSFRIKDSNEKVMLGAKNEYQARCRKCFYSDH